MGWLKKFRKPQSWQGSIVSNIIANIFVNYLPVVGAMAFALWKFFSESKGPDIVLTGLIAFAVLLWIRLTLIRHRILLTADQEKLVDSIQKETSLLDKDIAKVSAFI